MKEHDTENTIHTTRNTFRSTNQIQCLRCTLVFPCGKHYYNNSFSPLQFYSIL